jgi:hypothetical protein
VESSALRDVAAVAALQMELRRAMETRTLERWAGSASSSDRSPARVERVRPPRRRPRSR